ncbi:MAG: hypothetical protein EBR82_02890 [Caulobacteraceae bacterium]|nr:hypothetical protein [Caulobacteraceae bacterium]
MSGARRLTGLQQRSIDRAIDGGRHRISINAEGVVIILPIDADPGQADAAALDAEIRELLETDGDARH